MAGVLDSVNQRTQLVGQNRLELLTFQLMGRQRYGINVFKVKEVLQCPKLTLLPNRHPFIKGIAHIRGQAISVIDLSLAIGGLPTTDTENSFIIISEFNRSTQGFLVRSVERIVNLNWESILTPPANSGKASYLTAVTNIDDQLVEILDVEKVLAELNPIRGSVSDGCIQAINQAVEVSDISRKILIADDSMVARKQIERAITSIGFEVISVKDGREALRKLEKMAENGSIHDQISLVISDIEMPEMDGYTLTANIRDNQALKGLYVILHTSLSGVFNKAMVERVGANAFIAKFNPEELGDAVKNAINNEILRKA